MLQSGRRVGKAEVMSEADVEGSSESLNVPVLQRGHGDGRGGYGGSRYGGDWAGGSGWYWGRSLGAEYGILVFAKGSGENGRLAA